MYDRHKDTNVRTLLIAWVELLPAWFRAGPSALGLQAARRQFEARDQSLLLSPRCPRRAGLVSSLRARRSFRAAIRRQRSRLSVADIVLASEPPWPATTLDDDATSPTFWPPGPAGARRHHLVPIAGAPTPDLWTEAERTRAAAWLESHLATNLFEHTALWGSVFLVLPNPLCRRIRSRLSAMDPTRVLFHAEPGPGRSVAGLELTWRNAVEAGYVRSDDRTHCPTVSHPRGPRPAHGRIRASLPGSRRLIRDGAVAFLRSVQVAVSLVRGTRRVKPRVRASRRGDEPYEVPIVGDAEDATRQAITEIGCRLGTVAPLSPVPCGNWTRWRVRTALDS